MITTIPCVCFRELHWLPDAVFQAQFKVLIMAFSPTQTRTKGSEKRPLELEAPHNQMLPGQHSEESQVSLLYKVKDKQRKQEALTRNKSPRPKRGKLCLQKAVKQGFPRCVLGVVHHWGQDKEERHLGQRADWRVRQGMEGLRLPQQPTSLALHRPTLLGPQKAWHEAFLGKNKPTHTCFQTGK